MSSLEVDGFLDVKDISAALASAVILVAAGEAAECEEAGDLVRGREGNSHINTKGLSLRLATSAEGNDVAVGGDALAEHIRLFTRLTSHYFASNTTYHIVTDRSQTVREFCVHREDTTANAQAWD